MSSVFSGMSGLRSRYRKILYTDMTGATANSQATALLVMNLDVAGRYLYIDNTMDKEITIYLCHPESDPTVATNRLFWFEIDSLRVINFDQIPALGMEIDPGTRIFVSYQSGTPTSGNIKFVAWG